MKSLIINCLNETNGIADKIINSFIEKLENLGSEIKVHTIKDLDIKPCFACTAQYSYVYGDKCRCDDDMNTLLPDFKEHNNWVFVTRIDKNGNLEYFKNVLDRMEPLFQPISFDDDNSVSIVDLKFDGNIMLIGLIENHPDEFAHKVIRHLDSTAMLFNKSYASTIFVDTNNLNKYEIELSNKVPLLLDNSRNLVDEEIVA